MLTNLGYDVWDKDMLFIASMKNSSKPPLVNHTRDSNIAIYDVYNMDAFTTAMKILELDYDISLNKKDMKGILSMYTNKDKFLNYKGITFQFFKSSIGNEPYSIGIQFFID